MFIPINDHYAASRDAHGWTLTETQDKVRIQDDPKGRWKKGDDYRVTNQTYFGKLEHLCASVIDNAAGAKEVTSVLDMLEAIDKAAQDCVKAIARARLD